MTPWCCQQEGCAAGEYVVPVASGLIAGESLMAVLISALMAIGVAQK